jgi:thiopeptide-type bacteriocin biosynthesis protein
MHFKMNSLKTDTVKKWVSHHIFGFRDHDKILGDFVLPLTNSVYRDCGADRFFFIRYNEDGNHLRLRWRIPDDKHTWFALLLENQLKGYIRRKAPYVDAFDVKRSLCPRSIEFEVARYGGNSCIAGAIELFCYESALVMSWFGTQSPPISRSQVLNFALKCRLQLAWALSLGVTESLFFELMDSGSSLLGSSGASFGEMAEKVFQQNKNGFISSIYREIEHFSTYENEHTALAEEAEKLIRQTITLPKSQWFRQGASHLHMMANRMGLIGGEEVYLSRLSFLTVLSIAKLYPKTWHELWNRRRNRGCTNMLSHNFEKEIPSSKNNE